MNILNVAPSSTIVKFDPSARQWQAINGRTWSWPAGPAGKRQAQLCALETDVPEVAAEVVAIIANAEAAKHTGYDGEAIIKRVIKAGFVIRDGKVLPPVAFDQYGGCINEIARVRGSQPGPYIISFDGDECHCDCPDYQLGNAPVLPSGQVACKHIIAVLITEATEAFSDNEYYELIV